MAMIHGSNNISNWQEKYGRLKQQQQLVDL